MRDLFPKTVSPITELSDSLFTQHKVRLLLKRDDLLHESWGGNKWRKLKYNLLAAREQSCTSLLTFGGAYSNHIAATAAAGKAACFRTIGFIRGEQVLPLNPTLAFATACGMELHYLNREEYRERNSTSLIHQLRADFPGAYLLPEGGSNSLAVKGCAELVKELPPGWDFLCCPVGTGGTLAGMIAGAQDRGKVLGFSALKGSDFLHDDVSRLLTEYQPETNFSNWELLTDYHFGGYAKVKPELLQFMHEFEQKQGIQLEPVYTGKMLFGVYDLIAKGYFPTGSTIVAVHTGGLQGLAGMQERGLLNSSVS
jgi:1-aminocyclopropane-1-carboxylate deaminase